MRPDSVGAMKLRGSEGTMSVTAFLLDAETESEIERTGLPLLAEIAAGLRSGAGGMDGKDQPRFTSVFEIGEKECCAYEIIGGTASARGVVFRLAGKYYECEAAREGPPDRTADTKLFIVQDSFISRLREPAP